MRRAALDDGTHFLDDLLGAVPASRDEWLQSAVYSVRGTHDRIAAVHLPGLEPAGEPTAARWSAGRSRRPVSTRRDGSSSRSPRSPRTPMAGASAACSTSPGRRPEPGPARGHRHLRAHRPRSDLEPRRARRRAARPRVSGARRGGDAQHPGVGPARDRRSRGADRRDCPLGVAHLVAHPELRARAAARSTTCATGSEEPSSTWPPPPRTTGWTRTSGRVSRRRSTRPPEASRSRA